MSGAVWASDRTLIECTDKTTGVSIAEYEGEGVRATIYSESNGNRMVGIL